MDKDLFLRWLLRKRRLKSKVAYDTVSRCKRIESILGQTLESAVASQGAFEAGLTEIKRIRPQYNDLLYAMRLYAMFKNSKLDAKRYARAISQAR
jgi:hypothetical protein